MYVYTIIEQIPKKKKEYETKKIDTGYFMVSELDGEHIGIDATFYNHFGRYINHCCPPKSNATPVLISNTDKLGIEAERDIEVWCLSFAVFQECYTYMYITVFNN